MNNLLRLTKSLLRLSMTIIIISFFSGCAYLEKKNKERNENNLITSNDKMMNEPFIHNGLGSKYHVRLEKDYLNIDGPESCELSSSVSKALSSHSNGDLSKDDIANKYIQIATNRNHEVRLYKTPVNQAIESLFNLVTIGPGASLATDLDSAFIEFDASGRIVSTLTRAIEVTNPMGLYHCFTYSHIMTGESARYIEQHVGNALLNDGLISILTKGQH